MPKLQLGDHTFKFPLVVPATTEDGKVVNIVVYYDGKIELWGGFEEEGQG